MTNRSKLILVNGDIQKSIEYSLSSDELQARLGEYMPKLADITNEFTQIITQRHTGPSSHRFDLASKLSYYLSEIDLKMRTCIDELFDSYVTVVCAPCGSMFDPIADKMRYQHILYSMLQLLSCNASPDENALLKQMGLDLKDDNIEYRILDISAANRIAYSITDTDKSVFLNPTDLYFYHRYNDLLPQLREWEQISRASKESCDQRALMRLDIKIRSAIDQLFDASITRVCYPTGLIFEPLNNGTLRSEHLVSVFNNLFTQSIEEGLNSVLREDTPDAERIDRPYSQSHTDNTPTAGDSKTAVQETVVPNVTDTAPADLHPSDNSDPVTVCDLILQALNGFNIRCSLQNYSLSPLFIICILSTVPGTRINKLLACLPDLEYTLGVSGVRILRTIQGEPSCIGILVPRKDRQLILLDDLFRSDQTKRSSLEIPFCIGADIYGEPVLADLSDLPHLLISGQTGSGMSMLLRGLLTSLIHYCSPDQLKLVLIDPKEIEFIEFASVPHLLVPIVSGPKRIQAVLRWIYFDITTRYKKFAELGVRSLRRYNASVSATEALANVVIVIDELALPELQDEVVLESIESITRFGRAAGVHLVLTTQYPSTEIIPERIKSQIPARCALAVSSASESRLILGEAGAERLLGGGECLFKSFPSDIAQYIQCPFVTDAHVVKYCPPGNPQYIRIEPPAFSSELAVSSSDTDNLLKDAVQFVLETDQASVSAVHRRLRIGYARAARLIDIMEQRGYVSGFNGEHPRKVLISRLQFKSIFGDDADQ